MIGTFRFRGGVVEGEKDDPMNTGSSRVESSQSSRIKRWVDVATIKNNSNAMDRVARYVDETAWLGERAGPREVSGGNGDAWIEGGRSTVIEWW